MACRLASAALLLLTAARPSLGAEAAYTYNIAPAGGPDAGRTTVSAVGGALSAGNDAVTSWANGANELAGRTITVTYDLGTPQTILRLKARAIVPPWCNFSKGSFSVSADGSAWTEVGSQDGFPSHEVDGGATRTWEFEPRMSPASARYVRYEITPAAFVQPALSGIVIVPQASPAVAEARDLALSRAHGFYRPDDLPPGQHEPYFTFEKWRAKDPTVPQWAGPGGFIRLSVHNDSGDPWPIDSISLNPDNGEGIKLEKAIVKQAKAKPEGPATQPAAGLSYFSSSRFGLPADSPEIARLIPVGDPVWYQTDPNPVPAHGRAEVTVRLRVPPASLQSVTVAGAGRSAEVKLSAARDGIRIASYSFSHDIRRLYVYVERASDSVKPVEMILLDGKDMLEQTSALQKEWNPGGVAGYVVKLAEPLQFGGFHTLTVISGDGKMDTAQIRARDAFFPICMFGPPLDEEAFLRDISRNFFNSVTWCNPGPENNVQFGLRTFVSSPGSGSAGAMGTPGDPAVYGSWIYDEPDVHDYFGSELPEWLRLGTAAMYCVERNATVLQENPTALRLLNINSTFRPLNWLCYAQLGDILAHDPYYSGNTTDFKDPMVVYASMKALTENARPKPTMVLLYACADTSLGFPRFMSPEEVELENAYALAAGAKGVSYWWYRDSITVANNPALMRAMGRVNVRLQQISEFVANGIPTDWAKAGVPGQPRQHPIASGPVRVWCATIWSPQGLVVFVCNNEYLSNEKGFTYEPVKNVPVTVQMPDGWTDQVALYEVTDSGTGEPRQLDVKDGQVRFTLDSVPVSRWFVIKHPAGAK